MRRLALITILAGRDFKGQDPASAAFLRATAIGFVGQEEFQGGQDERSEPPLFRVCAIEISAFHLESHAPANGVTLLGEINGPHPTFAQGLDDAIAAEVLTRGRSCGSIRLSPELVVTGTLECALDQTIRTESFWVAGTQFRAALWTAWHFVLTGFG
jgi:hypothetical protein